MNRLYNGKEIGIVCNGRDDWEKLENFLLLKGYTWNTGSREKQSYIYKCNVMILHHFPNLENLSRTYINNNERDHISSQKFFETNFVTSELEEARKVIYKD